MKHSIRNSLVLIGILFLLVAGAWAFLHYRVNPKIADAKDSLNKRKQELAEINATINQYQALQERYTEVTESLSQHPKDLFPSDAQSIVYGFINALSTGKSYIDYNLKYVRTEEFDHYGVVRTSLIGTGYFTYLYRFISAIEHSAPLTKITALQITSLDEAESLGKVDVRMEIECYFYRPNTDSLTRRRWVAYDIGTLRKSPKPESRVTDLIKLGHPVTVLEKSNDWSHVSADGGTGWIRNAALVSDPNSVDLMASSRAEQITHNPFYPHIHSIPTNRQNLVDVSKSRIIGLTSNQVYLIDQSGEMQTLSRGSNVYLGTLTRINQKQQYAVFQLNRGGVREQVTLHVEKNN